MVQESQARLWFGKQRSELLRVFEDLLKCRSLGPGSELDRAFGIVRRELADAGVDSEIIVNRFGVSTLLATVDSGTPGPRVMLQGHMDVVPVEADWQTEPFLPTVIDDVLYARGSCDMKAGVAAFIQLLKMVAQTEALRNGSLTLLLDADEETGSDTGLIPFVREHGISEFDWAICAEPTAMRPYLGNRGLFWAAVEIQGEASHAGIPYAGKNPVPVLAELIAELPQPPALAGVLGGTGPSLTPTVLKAGEVVNSIAASAKLLVDRRVVPAEDPTAVRQEFEVFVEEFGRRHTEFEFALDFFKEWPPCLLDADSKLAAAAMDVVRARGRDAEFGFDDACNDASFISEAGVPTLIWGPGEPEMAHVSDEGIALDELYIAPEMYYEAVLRLGMGANR